MSQGAQGVKQHVQVKCEKCTEHLMGQDFQAADWGTL